MVERGEFRQDLYFRINVFPIHVPSINERRDDIGLLARAILRRLDDTGRYLLTDSATTLLKEHHYTGNIRELRNILSRALVLANTPIIDGRVIRSCLSLDESNDSSSGKEGPAEEFVDLKTQEMRYLRRLLAHCGGDKARAAEIAGISLRSLYRKLEEDRV
jgi:DNA-binding NtrC family response regulator